MKKLPELALSLQKRLALSLSKRLALSLSKRLALSLSKRLALSLSKRLALSLSKGFTLIELMVTVSIIVILSGASLIGYNRFQERQTIIQAARRLQQELRLTQERAISGYKPSGWCSSAGDSLNGYRLRFTGANVYVIEGICSSGDSSVIKSVTMNSNVTRVGGDDRVIFYALPGDAADKQIDLRATLSGQQYNISVYATAAGAIYLGDISVS